jgi:hypothetical protein
VEEYEFWDYVIEWLDRFPEAEGEQGVGSKPREQRTFVGRAGPYLTRYTLGTWVPWWRRAKDDSPAEKKKEEKSGWSLHVNVFHRSDEDPEPHSHPWPCASIMLSGGYREERASSDRTLKVRIVLPGMVNVLPHGVFHRVDLLEGRAITLFVTGPKRSSWTFLDLNGMKPWREFIRAKGLRTS